MRITVTKGNVSRLLTSKPTISFELDPTHYTGLTATDVRNQITVTPVIDKDRYDRVAPELETKYIKTINGVAPNNEGEFFIDGSDCVSWDYIIDGRDQLFDEPIGNGSVSNNGISLVDLCPACKTCEYIYKLQYEVESFKLWINTLKDVNLYNHDDMDQRRTDLGKPVFRVTGDEQSMEKCGVTLTPDDAYLQIRSVQLLHQYMTVVHMWNYVVSQNNASNVIELAPEDTTGFVVKTKRALPSCSCQRTISCTIDVGEPKAVTDDGTAFKNYGTAADPVYVPYPISIYVPQPVAVINTASATSEPVNSLDLTYEPFEDKQLQALNGAEPVVSPVPDRPTSTSSKRVYTGVIDARVAGTYIVSAKFLPFVYYRIYKKDTAGNEYQVSVRGGNEIIIDKNGKEIAGGTATQWDFGISSHSVGSLIDPTYKNYLDAKTAPTCSVDFKLLWPITIKWEVSTEDPNNPDVYVEDYNFIANGIRLYYGDNVITGATISNPTQPEETQQGQGAEGGGI